MGCELGLNDDASILGEEANEEGKYDYENESTYGSFAMPPLANDSFNQLKVKQMMVCMLLLMYLCYVQKYLYEI